MRFIPAGAGNTKTPFTDTVGYIGLSPLARGTLFRQVNGGFLCRFIPAGAGNTRNSVVLLSTMSVYPRWRGEHIDHADQTEESDGLSPLARGTQIPRPVLQYYKRFIPAGAGNTYDFSSWSKYLTVYPRWRGEHRNKVYLIKVCFGLSPLARGTLPL